MDQTLSPFRDCDSGATEIQYSKKEGGWICGDSAGSLYESKPGSNGAFTTFDRRMDDSSHEGKTLTALALSPDEERCALATGDEVHIYDFPSIADCISPSIGMFLWIDGAFFSVLLFLLQRQIHFELANEHLFKNSLNFCSSENFGSDSRRLW